MDTMTDEETQAPASLRESPPPTPVRRRWVLIVLAALALLVAFLVWRGLHSHQRPGPGMRPGAGRAARFAGRGAAAGAIAVSAARAATGDITVRIPALGTVTPLATVTVKTQVNGQLEKIAFKEGQIVHAGEFLAQIDPRPYQAALDQSKGNLRRDQALLSNARLDLKRYEDLIKQDAVSQQQLDTQNGLVAQYEGTVEADKAQVSAAAVNLAYTHIVSPVTGRVGLRQVDVGNYVTPGDANGIVVITELQPITVIFPVPEDYVPDIQRRLAQDATLKVEAYDRTNRSLLATGKLVTLDNQIDTSTGTVKLRALFDNEDHALFPNQFVNVQLLQNVLQHQIVIPEAAVRRGAPNGVVSTFVYLIGSDHKVAVRPVTLGVQDGDRVAVQSGLQAGDLVVTEGGDRLREGSQVTVPGEADGGAQPNGSGNTRAAGAANAGAAAGGRADARGAAHRGHRFAHGAGQHAAPGADAIPAAPAAGTRSAAPVH